MLSKIFFVCSSSKFTEKKQNCSVQQINKRDTNIFCLYTNTAGLFIQSVEVIYTALCKLNFLVQNSYISYMRVNICYYIQKKKNTEKLTWQYHSIQYQRESSPKISIWQKTKNACGMNANKNNNVYYVNMEKQQYIFNQRSL